MYIQYRSIKRRHVYTIQVYQAPACIYNTGKRTVREHQHYRSRVGFQIELHLNSVAVHDRAGVICPHKEKSSFSVEGSSFSVLEIFISRLITMQADPTHAEFS